MLIRRPQYVASSDLLADPFNDSSFNTSLWGRRSNNAHITLTENSTEVILADDGTNGASDSIDSVATFNVSGRTMQCHHTLTDPTGGSSTFILWQKTDNTKYVGFSLQNNGLSQLAWFAIDGRNGSFSSLALETVASNGRTYCKIVHDAGTDVATFYLSADGSTWTSMTTISSFSTGGLSLASVKVNLQYNHNGIVAKDARWSAFRLY